MRIGMCKKRERMKKMNRHKEFSTILPSNAKRFFNTCRARPIRNRPEDGIIHLTAVWTIAYTIAAHHKSHKCKDQSKFCDEY